MKKLIIINGPNLNLLGTREPEIYGNLSFTEFLTEVKGKYPNVDIDYYQSKYHIKCSSLHTYFCGNWRRDKRNKNAGGRSAYF